MLANKNDMYQYEEVKDDEGRALAKEINAFYFRTSAKDENGGIDEVFTSIGQKFLNPDKEIVSNLTKEEYKNRGERLMREKIKNDNNNTQKKGCC